ncbi:MAG: hypothetical protein U0U66_05070 [Cytophagaceae bacterium]
MFTLALITVLMMARYFIFGKETLEINKYSCKITTPSLFGNQIKSFDVIKIQNIRIELDPYVSMNQKQRPNSVKSLKGTIRWEYDAAEVTFGIGLPEGEAEYILNYFTRKQYFKSEQF